MGSNDRSHDQSLLPTTDRTINCGTRRPIVRSIVAPKDGIVRSIVASCDRSYDRSYDQSCDCLSAIIHNWWCHNARSRTTYRLPLTNRRLEVLNMTIDLVATDFALVITHDLCDHSYVLSTICPRFQHFSVAGRS